MKKNERDFLNNINKSLDNEMFDKLDNNINYDKYKKTKNSGFQYKYLYRVALILFIILGISFSGKLLNNNTTSNSTNMNSYPSSFVTHPDVITTPGIGDYEEKIGRFIYNNLNYSFNTYTINVEKELKKELLGSVEVNGDIEGIYNVYRYNAGLQCIIIELSDNEHYFSYCKDSVYQFENIFEELKVLYNLKDTQMDGTTQTFIKEINLSYTHSSQILPTKFKLDPSLHDDIFYGLNESTKEVEVSRRKAINTENLLTSTANPGYYPSYTRCALLITTVDDLEYKITFDFNDNEYPTTFEVNGWYDFVMSERLSNAIKMVIDHLGIN